MSEELSTTVVSSYERALILGDLAGLKPDERLAYYKAVCDSVGLNPLTKPFDYITLNSKLVLYATRACADQLRKIHGVSVLDLHKEFHPDGVLMVTCKVSDKSGRTDVATGALTVSGLKGTDLANAMMKAETKAKRRATLSLCGLGVLDETEVETLSAPVVVPLPMLAPAVNQAAAVIEQNSVKITQSSEEVTPSAPKIAVVSTVTPTPVPSPTTSQEQPQPTPAAALPPTVTEVKQALATVAAVESKTIAAAETVGVMVPNVAAPVQVAATSSTDKPATSAEYSVFINQRASKIIRDLLPKAGLKDAAAANGVKNYLLKGADKKALNKISAADFERLLKALETSTPEQARDIVLAVK